MKSLTAPGEGLQALQIQTAVLEWLKPQDGEARELGGQQMGPVLEHSQEPEHGGTRVYGAQIPKRILILCTTRTAVARYLIRHWQIL